MTLSKVVIQKVDILSRIIDACGFEIEDCLGRRLFVEYT